MKKYILFALLISSFLPFSAKAAENSCGVHPSCEELGYTLKEEDCSGYSFLKCPFETDKVYCDSLIEVPCGCGASYSLDEGRCVEDKGKYFVSEIYNVASGTGVCRIVPKIYRNEPTLSNSPLTEINILDVANMVSSIGVDGLIEDKGDADYTPTDEKPTILTGRSRLSGTIRNAFIHLGTGSVALINDTVSDFYAAQGGEQIASLVAPVSTAVDCEAEANCNNAITCLPGAYWSNSSCEITEPKGGAPMVVSKRGETLYCAYVYAADDTFVNNIRNYNYLCPAKEETYRSDLCPAGSVLPTVAELKVLRERVYQINLQDKYKSTTPRYLGSDGCLMMDSRTSQYVPFYTANNSRGDFQLYCVKPCEDF